jgi:hypothetical protein
MRKLILLVFLFGITLLYAQEKEKTRTFYCEMIGSGNFSGNKIRISFDFGKQAFKYQASNENQLLDEDGKLIQFLSMIDALNYMSNKGWKLHTVYTAAIKGNGAQETYRYILEKEGTDFASVMEGIYMESSQNKEDTHSNKNVPLFKRNMKEDKSENKPVENEPARYN